MRAFRSVVAEERLLEIARRNRHIRTRIEAMAARISVPAAKAMVQIGSPGKKAFMIDPITIATSNCSTRTKMLNSPINAHLAGRQAGALSKK